MEKEMSIAARAGRRRHPQHQEVRQKVHAVIEPYHFKYLQNTNLACWLFC